MRAAALALVTFAGCATTGAPIASKDFTQHLEVPFRLRGADGRAVFRYGTNHDSSTFPST
jgi:hypothetical protein